MYANVNISDSQKKKLRKALEAGCELSLRLLHSDLVGNNTIALTHSQLNRLQKAYESWKGITIRMTKRQVAHNKKIEGGFLSLLAGLASKVLPALGIGALTGLASTGVQKLVENGLYVKKDGCVCDVETDGKRLLLEPVSSKKSFTKLGDELYLKKEGKLYDGRGLLLGPNSPFKNVPILGMLL